VVGINGGTTTTEVARALVARADPGERPADGSPQITVVTNALNIAHELAVRPQIKLVVTGGVVRSQSYELVGPLALPALERLTLDFAILGVDGISVANGVSTNNETEAAVNELMARRANTVVVVADASKLGRPAFARICSLSDVDVLVTGAGADTEQVNGIRDAGVKVITVRPPSRSAAAS
jgi:DeoR family transcriptional regulator of aga operon